MTSFEDQYEYPLEVLESAVYVTYRVFPNILDQHVMEAYDIMRRKHRAGLEGKSFTLPPRLDERTLLLLAQLEKFAMWLQGLPVETREFPDPPVQTITKAELVECLKHLQKSIKLWTKQGGRQGYLEFMSQFMPDLPEFDLLEGADGLFEAPVVDAKIVDVEVERDHTAQSGPSASR